MRNRQRTGYYAFAALVVLALGALAYVGGSSIMDSTLRADVESVQRAEDPTGAEAPEVVAESATEEESAEEDSTETEVAEEESAETEVVEEEPAEVALEELPAEDELLEPAEEEADENPVAVPGDATMYLSVPKLGISGAAVLDGEAGLEAGAMHLAGTGYPWQPGANTYIAGHRVGFPGTGSDHIFFNLPTLAAGDEVTLTDSLGQEYTYAVSEMFAVTPFDLWVTAPTGSDTVTLQVCTETPDDWFTIGPKLMESGPESGRLIVRAVPV